MPAPSAASFPFLGVQLLGYLEKLLGSFDAEVLEGKGGCVRGYGVRGYGERRAKLAIGSAGHVDIVATVYVLASLCRSPLLVGEAFHKQIVVVAVTCEHALEPVALVYASLVADEHLDYENRKAPESVIVEGDKEVESNAADSPDYDYFAIPDKMTFGKTGKDKDRSTIMYNGHITIKNIPAEAYEYVVNGKSAIEWLMERYVVKTDDKSGIRNDANAWAREHHEPRYILDLLLSVISVSIETQRIVRALPRLTFI